MNNERELVPAHPEGEVQIAGNQPAESGTSLDTFAGKIYVKWAPEATVSSLGLMPIFIEFLKTTGLFDKWVEELDEEWHQAQAAILHRVPQDHWPVRQMGRGLSSALHQWERAGEAECTGNSGDRKSTRLNS